MDFVNCCYIHFNILKTLLKIDLGRILYDLGMVMSIRWFCREFQKTYSTISIEKVIEIEENQVPDSLRTPIFRICQEALNNVAKHSKATVVNLFLQKKKKRIELTIRDNGQGFDLRTIRGGLGLSTIKERTELAGGVCTIASGQETGTAIHCSWPAP
ncbi:MAG: ATP-binding protein [Desulforhabdus sp.]|nr:ATP-binding protein [Desulforhabdus sp.]